MRERELNFAFRFGHARKNNAIGGYTNRQNTGNFTLRNRIKKRTTFKRLQQLMAGSRNFKVSDISREDILSANRETERETGIAFGSSTGSTDEIKAFGNMLLNSVADGLNANSYIRMMPHTTAANISIFFGLKGRLIPTSSACTSGSQGIGYAYEAIKYGRLKMMLAGGAEELCPTEAMVFDALYATSLKNDTPHLSPRPYDSGRDGLVIGEGAGILVLEELEHALARGATIHAEIVGFGCNSDGIHATKPEQATMRGAMELALEDAGLEPSAIGYVNGHGTATAQGDVAESLRRGVPSASTSEANAILEALFVECEASLIERAAAELGVPLRFW